MCRILLCLQGVRPFKGELEDNHDETENDN